MTPIDQQSIKAVPAVKLQKNHGCWPFRRVCKHDKTELTDLAERTLKAKPHPSFNDQIIDIGALRRSQGHENISELTKQLEAGEFLQ